MQKIVSEKWKAPARVALILFFLIVAAVSAVTGGLYLWNDVFASGEIRDSAPEVVESILTKPDASPSSVE